ncbi:hypothetical protein BDV95DRAFT_605964 [Massariosphaeria phaeospora]|uniref:Uncharacterized protein n=1 Tax=Massariosphaeria phaeospora TaxID=100035 RepID=A0A7C8M6W6_9PLEO|nr:hypothetical protein BDV95DRAFT_605964 [Massariosphaeria phaeospora]
MVFLADTTPQPRRHVASIQLPAICAYPVVAIGWKYYYAIKTAVDSSAAPVVDPTQRLIELVTWDILPIVYKTCWICLLPYITFLHMGVPSVVGALYLLYVCFDPILFDKFEAVEWTLKTWCLVAMLLFPLLHVWRSLSSNNFDFFDSNDSAISMVGMQAALLLCMDLGPRRTARKAYLGFLQRGEEEMGVRVRLPWPRTAYGVLELDQAFALALAVGVFAATRWKGVKRVWRMSVGMARPEADVEFEHLV